VLPPPRLCTDNGVMVAWAGVERLQLGLTGDPSASARARWPLDPAAEPAPGAGVKA
jgi:N6-L-threonylcarbamoyladenine synthase